MIKRQYFSCVQVYHSPCGDDYSFGGLVVTTCGILKESAENIMTAVYDFTSEQFKDKPIHGIAIISLNRI